MQRTKTLPHLKRRQEKLTEHILQRIKIVHEPSLIPGSCISWIKNYIGMLFYIAVTDDGISIRPIAEKVVRTKPRDKDEVEGLMSLASAKIRRNLETGKVRWTGKREMVRKIEL